MKDLVGRLILDPNRLCTGDVGRFLAHRWRGHALCRADKRRAHASDCIHGHASTTATRALTHTAQCTRVRCAHALTHNTTQHNTTHSTDSQCTRARAHAKRKRRRARTGADAPAMRGARRRDLAAGTRHAHQRAHLARPARAARTAPRHPSRAPRVNHSTSQPKKETVTASGPAAMGHRPMRRGAALNPRSRGLRDGLDRAPELGVDGSARRLANPRVAVMDPLATVTEPRWSLLKVQRARAPRVCTHARTRALYGRTRRRSCRSGRARATWAV